MVHGGTSGGIAQKIVRAARRKLCALRDQKQQLCAAFPDAGQELRHSQIAARVLRGEDHKAVRPQQRKVRRLIRRRAAQHAVHPAHGQVHLELYRSGLLHGTDVDGHPAAGGHLRRDFREDLDTDGIELIDETFIDDYPFLSEELEYDWKNTIARYNMKSVTMDIYLDVLQFRDHVMNYAEATERLKRDIIIASRLGFENVRCLISIPVPVIEAALPTAEKYNVRIGQEIHAPMPLVVKPDTPNRLHFHAPIDEVDRVIEMIERTGTKHAGFVPDMGLFQHGLTPIMYAQALRNGAPEEAVAFLKEKKGPLPNAELQTIMTEQFGAEIVAKMSRLIMTQGSAEPKELLKVCPYIVSIHGKFYEMVEDPTKPGGYYDPSTDYAEIFKYLQEGGFDGYINSELEGQGYCNDLPDAEMLDEREQVRRQHEIFKALGAV